jgi:nicotinamide-nucleotide amidase
MNADTLAAKLVFLCRTKKLTVATAESCTGGMIAAALTSVPGSSAVLDRGFVTYSNAAKTEMLGVPAALIDSVGAVSEAVARHMAQGAKQRAGVDLAVSVTGVAGPDGGSPEKPVGTVWFGLATADGQVFAHHRLFPGDRQAIRMASTLFALQLLWEEAHS